MKLEKLPFGETVLFNYNKPFTLNYYNNRSIIPCNNNTEQKIYLNIKQMAFRAKPQKRTIIIHDEKYNILNKPFLVDVPEHLFLTTILKTQKKHIEEFSRLFVIKNNILFKHYFLNVFTDGLMCLGKTELELIKLIKKDFNKFKITDVVNTFWNSTFNYAIIDTTPTFKLLAQTTLENYTYSINNLNM